jgi:peptide/nickel transport system substrate-binding protein
MRFARRLVLTVGAVCLLPVGYTWGQGSSSPTGEIVLSYVNDGGGNYDPHVGGMYPGVGAFLDPVFDSLVTIAGDGKVGPSLAASWEIAPDGRTVTMSLRKDVVFHDGAVFDAAAAKANLERGANLKTSNVRDQLAIIDKIDAVDSQTLRLHLNAPATRLLPLLGGPAGMMLSPATFNAADVASRPVGTGPWRVSPASVPAREMVYDAFDKYWNKSIQKAKTIKIRSLGTPAQVAALIDGSVHGVMLQNNPQDAARLRATGRINIEPSGMQFLNTIYLNKSGPLANENARLALSHAIDRKLLADTVLSGLCVPNAQAFSSESWAFDPNTPAYAQDEKKVREYLKKAGMPDGFTFSVVVSSAGGLLDKILTAVQGMVEPYGIKLEMRLLVGAQIVKAYTSGETLGWNSALLGAYDPSIIALRTVSRGLSPSGYEDPAMQKAMDEANAAEDQPKRQAAMRAWSKRYQETVFHLGICNQVVPLASNKKVTGLRAVDPLTLSARGASVAE